MLVANVDSPPLLPPADALSAVVHPDPYPYYASLAAHRPFDFDSTLGLWVAAGPQALADVLAHPACRVRPEGATVPGALLAGAAGPWFGSLVRMNDGLAHAALKPWLAARLATLHADENILANLRDASQAACADAYLARGKMPTARLDDYVFRQPIYGLAAWLGVPPSEWAEVYGDVHKLVAAMAESAKPSPRPDVLTHGHNAAVTLGERATRWLEGDASPDTWLRDTARNARYDRTIDAEALVANIVGLFTQAHDACAGLVANSLRRLARQASTASAARNLAVAIKTVGEVTRFDPPVQNTRRFLHAPAVIGGRTLARGDVILVVLASAPASSSPDSNAWTFGSGAHTCPGRTPANTIAAVGVEAIIDSGFALAELAHGIACHPLGNVRIARFHAPSSVS